MASHLTLISTVQPSILDAIKWKDVAFRPSDTIVDAIDRFYKSNWARPTSERLRFHEVSVRMRHSACLIFLQTDISASDYTLMVSKDQKEPIYTRHPISGVVTKHEHPFNTLPRFSLSAHPVFVIAYAYGMLLCQGNTSDKIQQIGLDVTRSVKNDFLQVQVPLPSTETPLASLFRSRTTSSFSATSRSPENSGRKRRRQCEVSSGVIEWVDQIRVVTFDELPQDDLVLYSSEPSKPYATVVECDQAWLAVVERKEKRRQLGI